MNKWLITAFIILSMVGSFYIGNYLSRGNNYEAEVTAPEILEQAKNEVPKPLFPPKPAGRSVTTIEQKKIQVPETRVVDQFQTVGPFGLKVNIPKVVTTTKEIVQDVPSTKLVDASPEEIAMWNGQVKKLEDKFERDVQERAKQIAAQKASQKRDQLIEQAKGVTKDLIIPLITALTGLIGALAALRWGSKSKPGGES
jgi:hypothetical protein